VPYQVEVSAYADGNAASTPVVLPTDTIFATFKELLQAFPDVARVLLRGELGPPINREGGMHRYERRLTLVALQRDFPHVAEEVSRHGELDTAAREATLHLQVIESGPGQ
jgi:hypothetical protein